MMAALWDDTAADVGSAKRNFGEAAALYRGPMMDMAGYVLTMAFQHVMRSGYTSFEAGLRRLLHLMDEPLPTGPDSHAALVRRLARAVEGERPAFLDEPLLGAVEELLRFRRVAMHGYDDFAPARATLPVEAAETFLATVDAAFVAFRATLDPLR